MLAAEVDAIVGAKGKHQDNHRAMRHGHQGGYVVLGGRKVKVQRPRVRTRDGKEVELHNYQGLQHGEILDEAAFERMLYGVACRHYGAVDGGLPEELEAYGDSKSAVSARFARATGELLQQFLHRPIETRMLVVYMDAIFLGSHAILVALGVDEAGRKQVLGIREGSTENTAVTAALLEDLAARPARASGAAVRHRWLQGDRGGGGAGLRRACPRPEMPSAQEEKCCGAPAQARAGLGQPAAKHGLGSERRCPCQAGS
jgi:hypothetical protein